MKKGRRPGGRKPLRILLIVLGCILAAAVAASVVLYSTGYVGRIVGQTVMKQDVRDFFYTLSSSTNPPQFQRWRFYEEDGKKYFYHEKREGDHWPLREGDITISGTRELTEAQWDEFFECLQGGSVQRRRDSLESGGRGPWLYLYWRGDRGVIQQFDFADASSRLAFEDLCRRLMEE
jgi:hypothetical protein